jgi:hypothetical protein
MRAAAASWGRALRALRRWSCSCSELAKVSLAVEKREGSGPVDEDDPAAVAPEAGFDQQRRIDDAEGLAGEPVADDLLGHEPAHGGVDDAVQLLALGLVVEDDAAQCFPVQRPVWVEDVRAEEAGDGGEGGRAGFDGLAGQDVEVD